MSQKLQPINGGVETIELRSSPVRGVFLSPQYTEVRNLTPRDTEWLSSRRPIYDRLPGVSERYRLDYPYEDNVAHVYIAPGAGYTGLESMAVQTSGNGKYLVIQAGNIAWKYGTMQTQPVIIDLELVGIGNAKYLLAYQMYYDDSPQQFEYNVTDFSLAGETLKIQSSTDGILGWRYTPQFAFLPTGGKWSNTDELFPNANQEAFISWENPLGSSLTKVFVRCSETLIQYEGTASIYYMTCGGLGDDGFCNSPVWEYCQTQEVQRDSDGQFFEFVFEEPIPTQGWKIVWSNPAISVDNIYVSGVLFKSSKPATATTNYALVAYPANSVPSNFTDSSGRKVPLTLCKLAYVDIDSSYNVLSITDIREVVNKNYEPISEWLTRFWDNNLTDLYEVISNFSENTLSPTKGMLKEYQKLPEINIPLSYNCP